ncbi:MAG: hypothetical protein A2X86_09590 [Bdellovibrionales bacterium GWA2_49_15]|nr:MAG: hypothetical protein A2X86_09590 [Bdellovibrionales bacterium GWA2_49_15]
MKLLILGGTIFLGRHIIAEALKRHHEVWVFNRGKSGPRPESACQVISGDRENHDDLKKLSAMKFDAIIDTCGYVPRVVRMGLELLRDAAPHYVFASTISVYAHAIPGSDETASVMTLDNPQSEDVQKDYGGLKALCESEIRKHFPSANTIVRLGFLVGPYDRIYRFPYWLERLSAGGKVIAPGEPSDLFQLVDIRDAAAWMVLSAEKKIIGDFNLTGHARPMGDLLDTCNQVLGTKAQLIWLPRAFLTDQGVSGFDGIPYNISDIDRGSVQQNIQKALASGLTFRSLPETVLDTSAWLKKEGFSTKGKIGVKINAGISRTRELEVLHHYHLINNLPF